MSKKKISVFGANSKSAQHLIRMLEIQGFVVSSYSSTLSEDSGFNYDIYRHTDIKFDCDYAVYFSWATIRDEENQKIAAESAIEFARAACEQNVTVIFVSSFAALPTKYNSFYGFNKFKAEQSMKEHGHIVIRPGTIISEQDSNSSSSLIQLSKFRYPVRLFAFFSQELFVPILSIEKFSSTVSDIVFRSLHGEFNLVDDVKLIEDVAGFKRVKFRIPLSWKFISVIKRRGVALDRLVTLISVSHWIRENHFQIDAK